MYLTQMGEIPLLTRRGRDRPGQDRSRSPASGSAGSSCWSSDYAAGAAVEILQAVDEGKLPFDRSIKISMTEGLEKTQILGRMPHNLRTLEPPPGKNRVDFDR